MAKKLPQRITEERPGMPALMHTSRTHVVSPKNHENRPGTVPIVFPAGYKNRAQRRCVFRRKKQAKQELRTNLIASGMNHNTAGITARVLMDAPPPKEEPR